MSSGLGKYDLIRKLHQFQLSSCVELGTLQQLALAVIVNCYPERHDHWKKYLPCIPFSLRQEICKRLMYKGILNNDLFSLSLDVMRRVWDLRQVRENFTDQSCDILSRAKSTEILRLSHPSCESKALREMLQEFKDLRLLEVMNTKLLDDLVIQVVAKSCERLEVLNVKGTGISDESMLAISESGLCLTELDISYTSVSEVGIHHLQNGPVKQSLRLLRFKRCPLLGSAKLVRDVILGFPNLKDYSFDFYHEDEAEIGWALDQLPGPTPGQNVFFNIPLK